MNRAPPGAEFQIQDLVSPSASHSPTGDDNQTVEH